ncbi:MFS transporter [Actinomyces viscosus]|uniref:MFS transporter n=1 Tax=Actinomyces viscosus TaxID=1656 RepID=UPI0028E1B5C5|nr:MFS transporter [Actinomyces viscosus]
MATSYNTILSRPGARSFTTAGLIARFPMSMVGISTILAVEELYGSYTAAGLVSAANFVAMAVGAPVLARCVDRYGQSRVMMPAVVVSSVSLAGLVAAASARMHLGVLAVLAALAGGLAGSMGSLVRARWTAMLTRPEDVHAAFSLEAALDEVAFILGPVLATALCTTPFLPVTSGWVACLAMQLLGGLWFLSQRATEPVPHPHRPQRRAGATESTETTGTSEDAGYRADGAAHDSARHRPVLRYGAVVAAVVVFLLAGAMFGANDVAAVAFATEAGHKSASGLVLAVWGVGSFAAALLYGSRTWGWPLWKQLMAGLVALAVGTSTFSLAPNLVVLSVLALVTGLAIAPTLTSGNNIVQVTVAPSQLTEGLAWVSTALNVGVSVGSLLAGQAADAGGSRAGYLAVAGFAWVAVVAGIVGLPALRRARTARPLAAH